MVCWDRCDNLRRPRQKPALPRRLASTVHYNTLYSVTVLYRASTGINSLSVALGSTFGAFLALGVIVAFVLIAKYQYIRRKRKSIQLQLIQRCDDSLDSLAARDRVSGLATACDRRDRVTGAGGHEDADEDVATERRPTVNGTIELKRLSRQATLSRATDHDDDDDEFQDDRLGVATAHPDDDSRSSDFSADIILHDTVVQATTSGAGYPVSALPADAADGDGDSESLAGHGRLVLDSATCAGSFILANDEPTTGTRTYSLLVPINSPAVQPLLVASEAAQAGGGPRLLRISGGGGAGGAPGSGGEAGAGKSIVRLKLRKHATVDYSVDDEDPAALQIPPLPSAGPRGSVAVDGRAGARTSDTAAAGHGGTTVTHRVSVCCGRQTADNATSVVNTAQPTQTPALSATTSAAEQRRMLRSLSSDW